MYAFKATVSIAVDEVVSVLYGTNNTTKGCGQRSYYRPGAGRGLQLLQCFANVCHTIDSIFYPREDIFLLLKEGFSCNQIR